MLDLELFETVKKEFVGKNANVYWSTEIQGVQNFKGQQPWLNELIVDVTHTAGDILVWFEGRSVAVNYLRIELIDEEKLKKIKMLEEYSFIKERAYQKYLILKESIKEKDQILARMELNTCVHYEKLIAEI